MKDKLTIYEVEGLLDEVLEFMGAFDEFIEEHVKTRRLVYAVWGGAFLLLAAVMSDNSVTRIMRYLDFVRVTGKEMSEEVMEERKAEEDAELN